MFDKLARGLVRHILLPVPTAAGKGVLVAPTVFGNVLLGPTAEELDDKTATGSTQDGIAQLREKGRRILPRLLDEEVTAVYAGLRAATGQEDYRIQEYPGLRYIAVGGIRSTGLTASMAIAAHVTTLLARTGLDPGEPAGPAPSRCPASARQAYARTWTRNSSAATRRTAPWSATANASPRASSATRWPPHSRRAPWRVWPAGPGPATDAARAFTAEPGSAR